MDFAPTNETEDKLLLFMRKRLNGRVSVERLLSGMGIVNIFNFVSEVLEPKIASKDPEDVRIIGIDKSFTDWDAIIVETE